MIKQPKSCTIPAVSANPRAWVCKHEDWLAYLADNPTAEPAAGLINAFPAATEDFLNEIFIGKDGNLMPTSAVTTRDGLLKFEQSVQFIMYSHTSEQMTALNSLLCDAMVVIVEKSGINTEGRFEVYGHSAGLEIVDEFTRNLGEGAGAAIFTLKSNSELGRVENALPLVLWVTDGATTLAAIKANVTA